RESRTRHDPDTTHQQNNQKNQQGNQRVGHFSPPRRDDKCNTDAAAKCGVPLMSATDLGKAHSPPPRGGVAAPLTKWIRSEKARTGWSLTSGVSECLSEMCGVSDHPVCGSSVASRLLIDAAATPPYEGGECACPESAADITWTTRYSNKRVKIFTNARCS